MRALILCSTLILLPLTGCLAPVSENPSGEAGGSDGGAGGSDGGAGGSGGGAGGSGGGSDTNGPDGGLSCGQLVRLYLDELESARRCAPMPTGEKCAHKVSPIVGCFDCYTFVETRTELDSIQAEYSAKSCGFGSCPINCSRPTKGSCLARGHCQDG